MSRRYIKCFLLQKIQHVVRVCFTKFRCSFPCETQAPCPMLPSMDMDLMLPKLHHPMLQQQMPTPLFFCFYAWLPELPILPLSPSWLVICSAVCEHVVFQIVWLSCCWVFEPKHSISVPLEIWQWSEVKPKNFLLWQCIKQFMVSSTGIVLRKDLMLQNLIVYQNVLACDMNWAPSMVSCKSWFAVTARWDSKDQLCYKVVRSICVQNLLPRRHNKSRTACHLSLLWNDCHLNYKHNHRLCCLVHLYNIFPHSTEASCLTKKSYQWEQFRLLVVDSEKNWMFCQVTQVTEDW